MTNTYLTLPTDLGRAKIAAAAVAGAPLWITQAAVGDGSGAYYLPIPSQTGLNNEKWRGDIVASEVDPDERSMFNVRFIVPADVGGFFVREAALFDKDGDMIFICNLPDTKKEVYSSGSIGKLTVIMHVAVTDTAALTFEINPELDSVTTEQLTAAIMRHDATEKAHPDIWEAIEAVINSIPGDLYTKEQTDCRISETEHAHNTNPTAHPSILTAAEQLDGRLTRLEDMIVNDVTGNPWVVTFDSLDGLVVKGVWNEALKRIEF